MYSQGSLDHTENSSFHPGQLCVLCDILDNKVLAEGEEEEVGTSRSYVPLPVGGAAEFKITQVV